MLSHLDLFSGIGGFSLGLESAGVAKTVAFCDFDDYCQQVLKKNFPTVPIYNDVKELNYERLKADGINTIDIITGGYPCQPFSVAGRKKGEQDSRHVWPEMFRLIQELRPTWVIGENVGGHIKLGLDTVLENLESEGYSARTFSISASSIGANHKRERVWIMAHSERLGRTEGTQESKEFEGKNHQINLISAVKDSQSHEPVKMWPTPIARDHKDTGLNLNYKKISKKGRVMWATPQSTDGTRANQIRHPSQLSDKAKKGGCSNLREQVMWPTPRAAIGMGMRLTENMAKLRHKKYLETEVAYQESAPGGSLNPTWVEWLMGYPSGWTDLNV